MNTPPDVRTAPTLPQWLHAFFARHLPVFNVEACPGEGSFLTRWTIFQIGDFKVYLHRFNRSDSDHDMHDHPWWFISIILAGGYIEETPALSIDDFGPNAIAITQRCRAFQRPGSILFRPARWAHRVELVNHRPSWSLVLAGPKQRSWGFYTNHGWIPWKTFIAQRTCPEPTDT